ncbi:MAG TPA: acetoacetate decarboxylase family protein [Acidimicrobiales bacterium]|nr:acetoacetate decarboxylase family protein [Acidimicrobiales bacterium]
MQYDIAGRTVTMPVEVRDACAGTAMFDVDAGAAAALLPPGDAFTVVESSPGRAQLVLATIDYRDNDLGDYLEVGITMFVTPRSGSGSGSADREPGTFITRLPVNQEFTCVAGRTIWGFPKTVEDITVVHKEDSAVTTLRIDGELVLRLTLPRGGADVMPQMPMTTYTYIDGVPHATPFSQGGAGSQVLVGGTGVELELGTHPVADELAALGLPTQTPVMSTWTEHMRGTFGTPVPL